MPFPDISIRRVRDKTFRGVLHMTKQEVMEPNFVDSIILIQRSSVPQLCGNSYLEIVEVKYAPAQ